MYRSRLLSLIFALSLGSTSCWLRTTPRTTRVFVPPPSKPRPPITSQVPELPPAPEINVDAKMVPELPPADLSASLPTIAPPPQVQRRPTPPPRAAAPPPAPAAEAPPPPRLGQIFTAEQLKEYNRNLDESLDRVKKVLAAVGGRSLNPDMNEIVGRIQTFQKQAEQARELDLVTAVNLARRADLLAQDLIKRLP